MAPPSPAFLLTLSFKIFFCRIKEGINHILAFFFFLVFISTLHPHSQAVFFPLSMNSLGLLTDFFVLFYPGGASKGGGEEPGKLPEQAEEESQVLHGTGHCKWFNVRMGFGFISMISREGSPLDIPVDVFVHQVSQNFFFLPLFTFFQKELVGRFVNGLKIMCLSKSPLQSRVNPVFRACSWASSRMSFLKQKIFEISLLGVG